MPVPDELNNRVRQILADEASALAESDIAWDWEEVAERIADAIAEHPFISIDHLFKLIRVQGDDLIENGKNLIKLYPGQLDIEGRARILAGNALQELSVVISCDREIEALDRAADKTDEIVTELADE